MKHPIYIISLGPGTTRPENPLPNASPAIRRTLAETEVLIGGRAQLALFAHHPADTITVGADTADLYARITANYEAGRRQAALCSGDALFFGLGARLAEQLGADAVRVLPGVSSLQAAAAVLRVPWERAIPVSLHGRADFFPLAHALMQAEGTDAPVFVLTDAESHPAAVAAWMLERGLGGMRMHVLEDLFIDGDGSARAARVTSLGIDEAARYGAGGCAGNESGEGSGGGSGLTDVIEAGRGGCSGAANVPETSQGDSAWLTGAPQAPQGGRSRRPQRVLWLQDAPAASASPAFGIPDHALACENKLFTKGPARAAGLAFLGIEPGHVVWDLGAGSGSVAVEAARLARRGRVYAVERDAARLGMIRENRRRFRALNLEVIEGAMPFCLAALQRPDRIFIGGGLGGNAGVADEILSRAWQALPPGGRLLAHCVLLSSLERARSRLTEFGAKAEITMLQASAGMPIAGDMRFEALNPVFLVLGEKTD